MFLSVVLFERLFNLVFDEKIDCRLKPSALVEERILNWSRINCKSKVMTHPHGTAIICFNYLQQRFYLVEPTMKSLSKGLSSEAIFKLIKVMISTQQ